MGFQGKMKKLLILQILQTVLLAFVFTQGYAASEAEEVKVLTLEDAVQSAAEHNVQVKTQALTLNTLERSNTFSWNSVSPTANVRGSLAEDFDAGTTSLSVTGTLNVALSANLYTQIRAAKLSYERGQMTYEQTCRQIEKEVRTAFYHLLYEQENLALQKKSLDTKLTQYRNNQEKFRNGQISELDVMTSRVSYEQQKPTVEQAETTFTNDIAAFKQVIGIEQRVPVRLEGSLDEALSITGVSFGTLPERDKPAPDVLDAQKTVEIAQNTVLSQRFSAYGPSITAAYSYGKTGRTESDDLLTTNSLSVGVTIPLDGYLPWSSGAVNIAAKKNELEAAKLTLENTKTSVAVQTENYLRKINLAIAQAASLKATVELAETTYEMTKTAYNYGKTDFLNLLNANDAVLSANVSLKSQAYSLISTILELEYLLGIPFGTIGK